VEPHDLDDLMAHGRLLAPRRPGPPAAAEPLDLPGHPSLSDLALLGRGMPVAADDATPRFLVARVVPDPDSAA
jgi:hypothetical protein